VSGKVTFPGKLVAYNVKVYLVTVRSRWSDGEPYFDKLHTSSINASGYYNFEFPRSSATVICLVNFRYNGGRGQRNIANSLSLMNDTNLNVAIPLGL
jgi:hypothetical protein